jgi:rhamnosyl/mannosyltransferase
MRELPEARLLVVGSGPMAGEWQALAADLGLGERVCFAGEVDDADLPSYFAAADLYVSSASHRSEAFGISILEAMASGLPVISTELGTGTSFVNLDGMTGHVVPPRDPPALAGALRELLASPDLRRRMGRAARERVEREFTLAVMTDRVIAVYEEVLSKG